MNFLPGNKLIICDAPGVFSSFPIPTAWAEFLPGINEPLRLTVLILTGSWGLDKISRDIVFIYFILT